MIDPKSLPKGFHYLTRSKIRAKSRILQLFFSQTETFFPNLVEFPQVSFLETFKTGSNIVGEKIFNFKDKKGRDLTLTPDALAHILNYYLVEAPQLDNRKFSWICPVFRYRNIPNRFFYQLGLSTINYNKDNEVLEIYLCLEKLLNFILKVTNQKIKLTIVNPGLIVEILELALFNDKDKTLFFYENIRNKSLDYISIFLDQELLPSIYRDLLIKIFSGGNIDLSEFINFKEGKKTIELINFFKEKYNVQTEFDLKNLYCSEIIRGLGFLLYLGDNKIGDGGVYSWYSNRYDTKIKNFISVCTGLNPLIRNCAIDKFAQKSICLISDFMNNIKIINQIGDFLQQNGYLVNIYFEKPKIKHWGIDLEWIIFIEGKSTENNVTGYFLCIQNKRKIGFENVEIRDVFSIFNTEINNNEI